MHIFCIAFLINAQSPLDDGLNKDIKPGTISQKDNKSPNQSTVPQIASISIDNNSNSDINKKTSDKKKNSRPEKTIEEKALDTNKYLVWIGILQLIVFGLQGWFLYKTVNSADKTAKSMENSERAYVFGEIIGEAICKDGSIDLTICVKNQGKTPALIKSIDGYPWSTDDIPNISDVIKRKDAPLGGYAIEPGGQNAWPFNSKFNNITNMKIVCSIRYNDIFGNPHHTNFCGKYNEQLRTFSLFYDETLTNYT